MFHDKRIENNMFKFIIDKLTLQLVSYSDRDLTKLLILGYVRTKNRELPNYEFFL